MRWERKSWEGREWRNASSLNHIRFALPLYLEAIYYVGQLLSELYQMCGDGGGGGENSLFTSHFLRHCSVVCSLDMFDDYTSIFTPLLHLVTKNHTMRFVVWTWIVTIVGRKVVFFDLQSIQLFLTSKWLFDVNIFEFITYHLSIIFRFLRCITRLEGNDPVTVEVKSRRDRCMEKGIKYMDVFKYFQSLIRNRPCIYKDSFLVVL